MITGKVRIRELAAWELDDHEYRPDAQDYQEKMDRARSLVSQRSEFQALSASLEIQDAAMHATLLQHTERADLRTEMEGLDWSVSIVDLRRLLAFQRRLALSPDAPQRSIPCAGEDWPALLDLCFGGSPTVVCEMTRDENSVVLRSGNPNLQFRFTGVAASPVAVYAGSPFFEVAQYRGRWFLRDGYHRAFAALRSGIFHLPAVIVRARTLQELGAARPWFFPEDVLFSSAPPRVSDFLDDNLVLEYDRSPLIRTLRVTMEETYTRAGEDR